MDKMLSVKLKGGFVSSVYSSTTLSSVEKKIESYGKNAMYVFDENTKDIVSLDKDRCVVLPSGESAKNYKSIAKIIDKALSLSLARDSIFVAIGGGVVCDMTAFASSIYMRGARLSLVPTTLLSIVDASLGGKTGIDYCGYKNLIGSFYPAEEILICTESLKSLSEKEYICGLGEVVKHAFLSPSWKLYDFLCKNSNMILNRDLATLLEMIKLSLEVKKHYIEIDPEEKKGIRSFLNLGHTFGHALESITNYKISHGEGVAWGVAKAIEAGEIVSITSDEYKSKAFALLSLYPFDTSLKVPSDMIEDFLKAISKDKKKSNGSVKFVLMKGQGEPVLMPLEEQIVKSIVL